MGASTSMSSTTVAQRGRSGIAALDQRGDHRTVDRADQRAHQLDTHGSARSLDGLGHGLGALAQAAAHRLAQRGQAGTGDVTLVSRYQLLGERRIGHVAHQQVNQHLRGGLGSAAPPGQGGDPRPQLRDLDHPDVLDRAGDQIVERREVVSGGRQRQAGPPSDRPVTHRFEPAFGKQLGGSAHERIPSTFSLWSNCCSHD